MEFFKIAGEIKSPLRYPGGKSKAIDKILPFIPDFKEYREPFVGGGSVFLTLKQRMNEKVTYKINDLNTDLICFWKIARDRNEDLTETVRRIKGSTEDGRKLCGKYRKEFGKDEFERAVRFFIMNRITFSGLADCGGYSTHAFEKRFTESSIERISKLKKILQNVEITNDDYERLLMEQGEDVFIFLDPPYLKATKKRLYGKSGDLHLQFDHERFAKRLKECRHKWLITYDDCEPIRELFEFATIYEWELQYGMNNFKQNNAKKGKELFITNFEV